MLLTILCTALAAVAYASFFEWTLHRFLMHRPVGPFRYPFERHALTHHRAFKADCAYHLIDPNKQDASTIPMAWWNGPALIVLSSLPFALGSAFLGTWVVWMTASAVIALYYGAYEYIHWCMHLPKRRFVERTGIFFRLNGHHILHHRYMHRNFNVVLPLADLLLGTLMVRSPVQFAQPPVGVAVPNLQPLEDE